MAERADDTSIARERFDILMLMAVQEQLWLRRGEVAVEAGKGNVHFVVGLSL